MRARPGPGNRSGSGGPPTGSLQALPRSLTIQGQRADPAGAAAFGPPRGAEVLVRASDDDLLGIYKGLSVAWIGAISPFSPRTLRRGGIWRNCPDLPRIRRILE